MPECLDVIYLCLETLCHNALITGMEMRPRPHSTSTVKTNKIKDAYSAAAAAVQTVSDGGKAAVTRACSIIDNGRSKN